MVLSIIWQVYIIICFLNSFYTYTNHFINKYHPCPGSVRASSLLTWLRLQPRSLPFLNSDIAYYWNKLESSVNKIALHSSLIKLNGVLYNNVGPKIVLNYSIIRVGIIHTLKTWFEQFGPIVRYGLLAISCIAGNQNCDTFDMEVFVIDSIPIPDNA